jgi:hypothetical protein
LNRKLALALADRNARSFTLTGQTKCPLTGTGLIVLVYRQDDKAALAAADVGASGKSETTTAEGLAKFLPLAPDTYSVAVQKLTDPDGVLVAPAPVEKVLAEHTCPVLPIAVRVRGRPTLELLWKHDGKKVQGAKVKLDAGTYDFGTTGADGLAKWTAADPIKPAQYKCTIDIDGTACQLFSSDGATEIKPPKVKVPAGKKTLTFRVRRPSWVKLSVVRVKGTGTEDVVDAELKITWPDDGSVKAFKTAAVDTAVLAHVKDIAVVGTPPTCDVTSLDIPDGEVYEFVDVTTA